MRVYFSGRWHTSGVAAAKSLRIKVRVYSCEYSPEAANVLFAATISLVRLHKQEAVLLRQNQLYSDKAASGLCRLLS